MNFSEMDMKKEFEFYNRAAPRRTLKLTGGEFVYRYYKNPSPKVNATIVMLAGGTGLADGFFALARSFMERYSLVCFNYPVDFHGNEATADAIVALLTEIGAENAYLWGQSFGGLMAQIIAARHPEAVKGLLLTSTASLSTDLRYEGMKRMIDMISEEKERKNLRMYKFIPMGALPPLMNLIFKRYLKNNARAYAGVKELLKQIKPDMTKAYFAHMDRLLGDLRNQIGTQCKEDFEFLRGRVLIVEPDDDETFPQDVKEALFRMMPDPVIVRELAGGHLAMMLEPDAFLQIINDFMDTQGLDGEATK